ncbi:acyl--CoA ligase [Rhodobacteraceae bacterium D3-12]|nr:acyl--CoA ligase [Rhodobacteraceae bacterium D3-12]
MTLLDKFGDGTRLGDCLDAHARDYPDREALRDGNNSFTYASLHEEVMRCAQALYANGVRKGDRIAVLAVQRTEVMVTFFAAAKLGALWLGLNPKYTRGELEYVVSDARPKLIFGIKELDGRGYTSDLAEIKRTQSVVERTIGLDGPTGYDVAFCDWLRETVDTKHKSDFDAALGETTAQEPALLVYTSGSSGRPKGVLLRQRELLRRSITQNEQFPVSPYPRVLNPLPINHIGGMHFLTLYTFVGAGTVILADKHRVEDFVHALQAQDINILYTLPTMFQMLVEYPEFDATLLDDLQWIIYSGAAMPGNLVDLLFAAKCEVGLTYGMTETCGSVTYAKKDGSNRDVMRDSIGYATPLGEVRVTRADGTASAVGEDGEIQVRANHCMKGYFERPEATEEVFSDGWLKTGDIARLRADGSIEFVGRMSEMFKSGGYNVYPREVELAIEEHPDVGLCAVIDVPDSLFNEVGWAYIIQQPHKKVDAAALKQWCSQKLASYKIPKRFFIVDSLPMLPIGKVDKVTLKKSARAESE